MPIGFSPASSRSASSRSALGVSPPAAASIMPHAVRSCGEPTKSSIASGGIAAFAADGSAAAASRARAWSIWPRLPPSRSSSRSAVATASVMPWRVVDHVRIQAARSAFAGTDVSIASPCWATALASRVFAGNVFTSRITRPRRPRLAEAIASSRSRAADTKASAWRTTAARVAVANIGTVAASSNTSRGSSGSPPSNSRQAQSRSASSGQSWPRSRSSTCHTRNESSPCSTTSDGSPRAGPSEPTSISSAEADAATGVSHGRGSGGRTPAAGRRV
jgi:hypothetical protein